jgi:hypothetical protein
MEITGLLNLKTLQLDCYLWSNDNIDPINTNFKPFLKLIQKKIIDTPSNKVWGLFINSLPTIERADWTNDQHLPPSFAVSEVSRALGDNIATMTYL